MRTMTYPTVIEKRISLEPVAHDPFIVGLGDRRWDGRARAGESAKHVAGRGHSSLIDGSRSFRPRHQRLADISPERRRHSSPVEGRRPRDTGPGAA